VGRYWLKSRRRHKHIGVRMSNQEQAASASLAHPAEAEPGGSMPGGGHKSAVRTAVVVVHGMGEQLPLETLYGFVRTALPKVGGERLYYSRPERVSDSFEARRCLAPRIPKEGPPVQSQAEFFEYHWSYLMTGNKLTDLIPTTVRLLVRRPSKVPYGLRGAWVIVWLLLVAALVVAILLGRAVTVDQWTVAGVVAALLGQGLLAAVVLRVVHGLGNAVTKSFVDVVRYLDASTRSYENRRKIRKGMVDLLTGIHAKGRYSRVVIVAHSLGAYIAYDAIAYLWPQMCKLHCGPLSDDEPPLLSELADLEQTAAVVYQHPAGDLDDDQQGELDLFRRRQFALWKAIRRQGNPWLVTDFITLGTPMYFADLLYARDRKHFDRLVRTAQFPVCPPRRGSQQVEKADLGVGLYGWNNRGRRVLTHSAPYAVVRWTNLFYPVRYGVLGDWFGGQLRSLFGNGILDFPVLGNSPGRLLPGLAHGRYFSYPDQHGPDDIARVLQGFLDLNIEADLDPLLTAPAYLPETDVTN
jgi:hypothetical protein